MPPPVPIDSGGRAHAAKKSTVDEMPPPELPEHFHITDRWGHLKLFELEEDIVGCPHPGKRAAVTCSNIRGQIAHGRVTGEEYMVSTCEDGEFTVAANFEKFHGGAKVLGTVDAIKTELVTRGPVVSASFTPTRHFVDDANNSSALKPSRAGSRHPMLIIGWKRTADGEAWLLQNLGPFIPRAAVPVGFSRLRIEDEVLAPASDFGDVYWKPGPYVHHDMSRSAGWRVGFSRLRIEDEVLAPASDFGDVYWKPGPYFHHDMSRSAGWRGGSGVKMAMTDGQMKQLAATFPQGLLAAGRAETRIELCNAKKIAESRTARLDEIFYDGVWKVSFKWISD
eukprot:CAMPEP_0194347056 /NCGR_PEP_ID=MMETSP0171-20130528/105775_1 /TAXON_ID=218684 /ORGANISM="Corethron pennatum, Strain L29A3" /LENGTH=336 /DNA_ID=CAMNT_0039114259 /DNA_START=199 /DNA_END=1209 /DNA_ORIENTATION=+